MTLSDCIPVRLTGKSEAALRTLQRRTKVNKSALIRLAVAAGLPIVAAQFGPDAIPAPATPALRKPAKRKGVAA